MVSYISLSFCPLGANNASCFARRLISFALNVSQTVVVLVLLKIATPTEYFGMDQAASAQLSGWEEVSSGNEEICL